MDTEFKEEFLSLIADYHHFVFVQDFERAERLWKAIEKLIEINTPANQLPHEEKE